MSEEEADIVDENNNINESQNQTQNQFDNTNERKDFNNINNSNTSNVININDIKIVDKYHNYSIKQLRNLYFQKNNDLIRLNEEKENYKKILGNMIVKLNNCIISNSEYLYDDMNIDLLLLLGNKKKEKKKELENSKKIKNVFKEQLITIKNKISNNEKEKNKLRLIDIKIDNLRKKNILLKKEINEIKSKEVLQDKELEIINENKKYPLKIEIKTSEKNHISSQKHDFFIKISKSLKSLDNLIKELKRLDEMCNSSINEDTDENLVKNINFWMNLIKNDLGGDKNEIISKIENGKSKFLNEIKNRNDSNNNYNIIGNGIIHNGNKLNNTEEYSPKKINTENNVIKKLKNNKNNSSKILLSKEGNNNINELNKNKISSLYMKTYNSVNKDNKQTLFKKINYFKFQSPERSNKLKLNNIDNINIINSDFKGNNYYLISELSNDDFGANNNNLNIESNQNENNNLNINNNNNMESKELDDVLLKDYNEINDADYRELLNKKEQYLETNLRLEKNIDEIKKTKNQKISYISKVVKDNFNNLEKIKYENNLIEKEIDELCKVFQLTVEQAKLQNEINQKDNKKKKKIILKTEYSKNDENKLLKSYDVRKKNKKFEDIVIPRKKIKNIEITNSWEKKNGKETREEKLKTIKLKYKNVNKLLNEDSRYESTDKNSKQNININEITKEENNISEN